MYTVDNYSDEYTKKIAFKGYVHNIVNSILEFPEDIPKATERMYTYRNLLHEFMKDNKLSKPEVLLTKLLEPCFHLAVQELKFHDKEAVSEGIANYEYEIDHTLEKYLGYDLYKEYSFAEDEEEQEYYCFDEDEIEM